MDGYNLNTANQMLDKEDTASGSPGETMPGPRPLSDPLEAKISYFKSVFEKMPTDTTTLAQFLQTVRDGTHKRHVQAVRDAHQQGDDDTANELKKRLPAVCISGLVTSGPRANAFQEGRFVHSGFVQGDFDEKDFKPRTVDEIKSLLVSDDHVQAAFLSPRGGVKTLFRTPVCNNPDEHLAAFIALEKHFWEVHGLKMDKNTKDPVRMFYASSDPDLYLRRSPAKVIQLLSPDAGSPVQAVIAPVAKAIEDDGEEDDGFSESQVQEMLAAIPKRPAYDEWLRIASSTFSAVGKEVGIKLLEEWSPPECKDEYGKLFENRLTKIGSGTLVHIATQNGYVHRTRTHVPADVFPVPAGDFEYRDSGEKIFSVIAPTHQLFIRGRAVHEIVSETGVAAYLVPLTPERFVSLVEKFGHRVARREWDEKTKKFKFRNCRLPEMAAKVLLKSDSAREYLPPIRQLASCPVFTPEGEILGKGYHRHGGGTYVTEDAEITELVPPVAVKFLRSLLEDFSFVTPADYTRAAASFISPALKMGGFIEGDYPLDIAEADQSQSGKTYRQKLVCGVYNETPVAITAPKGGVGSLDETISAAMIKGRRFLTLDNFRGRLDSTIMESAIRGVGRVPCRALRVSIEVDTYPFVWQLSTNGADLNRDIANRAIITRCRKQPPEYRYRDYGGSDLLSRVRANQGLYLSAIFAIIREWKRHGCPRSRETRHDFREWCGALDWILQNICGMAPLLDGHREEQVRTSNPGLQWLRQVAVSVKDAGLLGRQILTIQLVEIADEAGVEFPGGPSGDPPPQRAGKILARLFRDDPDKPLLVDGFSVTREVKSVNTQGRGFEDQKTYLIRTSEG